MGLISLLTKITVVYFKPIYRLKKGRKCGIYKALKDESYWLNNDNRNGERLLKYKINVELNDKYEELGLKTRIWSFPMRYSPLFGVHAKDRKYVGKNWTRKQIRGVQCILNATHGVVGPKHSFFNRAFGTTLEDFERLLWMPEDYIIYRKRNEENGNSGNWLKDFQKLSISELAEFKRLIGPNDFKNLSCENLNIKNMFKYYLKTYNS